MTEFAVRGPIFSLTENPQRSSDAWFYFHDGVMVVCDGRVQNIDAADRCIEPVRQSMPVFEYPDCLICPGFIDTHIHYAQARIVGSAAPGLLQWLEKYTFPEELRFADADYAQQVAGEFLDELAANGTTSALVFPTVHARSVEEFFAAARTKGMRMSAGKVLMNRHAPAGLCDGDGHGIAESEQLIERWHENGRQNYAVTLRFAGTSTNQQMQVCGELVKRYPEIIFHTHLSETQAEIEWTLNLFGDCKDYLGVYEKFGLVTDHSVFAHCVHLSDSECERLSESGGAAALCPTSNLFLGSGLVDSDRLSANGINLSLGTDIGGGTSFSMLQTMQELYKVARTLGSCPTSLMLFYLATLGAARALHIDRHVGSLQPGKEADFVILDAGARPLTAQKLNDARSTEQRLFAYIILGDRANVRETWSMGRCLYRRDASAVLGN